MALTPEQVERAFGTVIAGRGYDYYRRDRVLQVLKSGNTLLGTVSGTAPEPYTVEVDLSSLQSRCTCPYALGCKHGAAVLYHVLNGEEVVDVEAILEELERMPKEELLGLVRNLLLENPFIAGELTTLGKRNPKNIASEFGRRLLMCRNFLQQQEEIRKLERAVRRHLLSLPAGREKALLLVQFLEEMENHLGYVDDSNGFLAELIYDCLEAITGKIDGLDTDTRRDVAARLRRLEERDEYGYFEDVSHLLGRAQRKV